VVAFASEASGASALAESAELKPVDLGVLDGELVDVAGGQAGGTVTAPARMVPNWTRPLETGSIHSRYRIHSTSTLRTPEPGCSLLGAERRLAGQDLREVGPGRDLGDLVGGCSQLWRGPLSQARFRSGGPWRWRRSGRRRP